MNAILSPEVLRWARNKAAISEAALANGIGVELGVVERWETTGSIPLSLVEPLAHKTRIPFGFLFLEYPPQPILPIADFRRVHGAAESEPSDDLLAIIYSAQLKQKWYREYLISIESKPLPFVGQSSLSIPAKETAIDIRATLGIGSSLAEMATTWEDALRYTIEASEEAGILVLRAGYAGGYTRRVLSVEEFRGFAISDEYAPLVFVNGADSPAAQMFTLAHEIAHVWIGQTGLSNLDNTYSTGSAIEKYCNSVAAEVLLPLEELKLAWRGVVNDTSEIERLSKTFKISRIVVARRARDAGLVTEDKYNSYYKIVASHKKKSTGGDYYTNEKYQNSRKFSIAIIGEALAGRTMQRDAMQFLGIKKEETFRKYARSLQME
jgi:Zn-dependent peptidase ImmA (M78 family)